MVYYAGHGRINSARQAEWTCKRDPNYASLDWSAIQSLFAKAKSDVLILLDTCAAASSTMRSQYGVMEAIVACGFESKAPPPGEHSFTNTLIEVLDDWINRRSFSASCLHAEILFQLKLKETRKGREGIKLEWCVTPIHINYTQDPKAPGIELCRRNIWPAPVPILPSTSPPSSPVDQPRATTFIDAMDIDFDDSHTRPSPLSSISSSGQFHVPHIVISLALEENQPDIEAKKAARWLEGVPFLAKWAKVECVFPSYSTLLILSVPLPIWNMLPDHPACTFVGYVTAPNLAVIPPSITQAELHGKTIQRDVKIESESEGTTSRRSSPEVEAKSIGNITDPLTDSGYGTVKSLALSSVSGKSGINQHKDEQISRPNRLFLPMEDARPPNIGDWLSKMSTIKRDNERLSKGGLDPETRKLITDLDIPSLRDQEEMRHREEKLTQVQEWRSHDDGGDNNEDEGSNFQINTFSMDPSEQDNGIPPADDAASLHENRLVEGATYYHFRNGAPTAIDMELSTRPRQWNDPPSLPYALWTTFQPASANEAMSKWRNEADNFSIVSRAATWGSRRGSEPDLNEYQNEETQRGDFLTRLIFKPKPHHNARQPDIFTAGLDRLGSIVRKISNSKLKRSATSRQNGLAPASDSKQFSTGFRRAHDPLFPLNTPSPRTSRGPRKIQRRLGSNSAEPAVEHTEDDFSGVRFN